MNESHELAVLLINQAIDNGVSTEAKKKSEIPFRVKNLEELKTIKEKAEKILSEQHNKNITIDFAYTDNPKEVSKARLKHPNKIFQP